MASIDSYNNMYGKLVVPPAAYVATTMSAAVDMSGYESLTFLLQFAAVTDGTWNPVLYDCDTLGGVYAVVPTEATTVNGYFGVIGTPPTVTNPNSNYLYRLGYCGTKQFVKLYVVMTVGGTASFFSLAVQGDPRKGPTPAQVNP